MKKIYILILITTLSFNMYSQHLTLSNLDYLYKSNIEECDALLIQKGFVYDKSEKEDGKIRTLWYYKNSNTNSTTSNEYVYKYCDDKVFNTDCDLIQYLFSDASHFNSIKENIKKNNLAKFFILILVQKVD